MSARPAVNWTLLALVAVLVALAMFRPDVLTTIANFLVTVGGVFPELELFP